MAGCMTPVMSFGDGKTAKQSQHEVLAEQTPGRLVVAEKWNGEVASRTVRVWADNQFRAQNLKWQQTFDETLELANLVLTPLFGLRLVAEYRVWERHVPGSTLTDDLAALVEQDPASDGVFAVIGLTSSLPLVSATFEQLGLANIGGRHLVVRGYADLAERKLYADVFRDLLPEERELALVQRRQHKTAVVFLHELGHNLGAEHDDGDDLIMSAAYSHRSAELSPHAKTVMRETIDARLGRRTTGARPEVSPTPAAITAPREPLVLIIAPTGEISHGAQQSLSDLELENLLAEAFAADKTTEVIIQRARKAPSDAVKRIVSRATAIGLTKVSIALY